LALIAIGSAHQALATARSAGDEAAPQSAAG
jgi:hypothetical protein